MKTNTLEFACITLFFNINDIQVLQIREIDLGVLRGCRRLFEGDIFIEYMFSFVD